MVFLKLKKKKMATIYSNVFFARLSPSENDYMYTEQPEVVPS